MHSDYYVYVHRRADDNLPFYVGKGRAERAWKFSERNKYWNNTKNKHGVIVEIVFDGLTEEEAFQCEIDTILEFTYFDYPLTNLTRGGEGLSGYKQSEEHRKRMGQIRKNSKKWQEGHKKAAEKLKGRKLTPEHTAAISAGNKGKTRTSEQKAALSEAKKNCPKAQAHIRKVVEELSDKNVYTFYHITSDVFVGTRLEFSAYSKIDLRDIAKLFMKVGTRKSTHNWALSPLEIRTKKKKPLVCPQRRSTNIDKNIYTFYHVLGETFVGTRKEFSDYSQIEPSSISGLFCKNPRRSVFGWTLNKLTPEQYTHLKI